MTAKNLDTPASTDDRDRLVLEHLPLVRAIAARVRETLPPCVDLDDLIHAGVLGLFDAATKYNVNKEVSFATFAKFRIRGAMLDSLRQLDWASRDLRRRLKQVESAKRQLSTELQRAPTEDELVKKLGLTLERWHRLTKDLHQGPVSASTRLSEQDEPLPPPDSPASRETEPDTMCARRQVQSVLSSAMKTLPVRYQKVVLWYYTKEMSMKEIGHKLGINQSRVSQIHSSALARMNASLQSQGIQSSHAF